MKLNSYFNRIFVINLIDNKKRWEDVYKQFKNRGIKVERFIAIDGRCKNLSDSDCLAKLKSFEMSFNVKIARHGKLQNILPISSLNIGTLLLLREMVRKNWERILICEDDIYLDRNFQKKFSEGIKSIKDKSWDLLYLGCGHECGNRDVSWDKSKKIKYLTPENEIYEDAIYYTKHPNDLRSPCGKSCKEISPMISTVNSASGTWCYAVSLKGAKKILKVLRENSGEHIDVVFKELQEQKKINALAFDPPIVWHENIRGGRVTDIPW